MSLAGEWKRRLQMLFGRDQLRRDLDEEMRLHIELRRMQQIESGLDPADAQRAAHRRFGNTTRMQEKSIVAWGWSGIETFLQDVAYGFRSMLRTLAITFVALISLALGIGANTAIFSFVDAVLLRSLPVKEPQQLVKLGDDDWRGITDSYACIQLYSYPFYRRFQRENSVFASTAAIFSVNNDAHGFVDGRSESEPIHAQAVSGTYFQTLGVGAQLGRVLSDADDTYENDHPVAVISDSFWKRSLGGDPTVLNRTLRLGTTVYRIVGVAPAEFFGTTVGESPDAWTPLSPNWKGAKENFSESLWIIGRLKNGVSIEQATANVNVLFPEILHSFPDAKLTQTNLNNLAHAHVPLESMARGLSNLRHTYSEPLQILMAIVALVLLVACANIANLLLARSSARARELAIRQALGAGRMRIMRQLLTESLLLALAGGGLGVAFAALANRLLLRMISQGEEIVPLDVSLNLHLLAFTCAVTIATALLFGVLPSLRATRVHLTHNLKNGRGSLTMGGRSPLSRALVVGQVALSLILLMGACLFLRTLNNLNRVDLGFNKQNVLRLNIDSYALNFKDNDPRQPALYHQIEERVNALPGVQAASFSAFTFREGSWNTEIAVPGMPLNRDANVQHNIIGNAYFKVMAIHLVAGRGFGPQDTATSQRVAIISEHVARVLFPAGSPIGRTYSIGDPDAMEKPQQVQVVGIVKDVKVHGVVARDPYIDYLPYSQSPWGFGNFQVRYTGQFGAVAREVQQAIHAINPNLPISNVSTLDAQVARSFANQAIIAELSAFFGVVAVFLSCIGLYGLMSYLVGRRTGEIGIRMALGARRPEVAWRIMREIGLWILAGIALGIPVTLAGGRLVQKMLYGLTGTDLSSLLAAIGILIIAGLFAGYLPARRAARVDPAVALRDE